MVTKDYYKILGVDKNADETTIKKAYRKLSKKYHPDLNPGDTEAEDTFKDIATAYETLSDKTKRVNYDRFGNTNGQQNPFGGGANMEDIMREFGFGGGPNPFTRRQEKKGHDLILNVKITLEDVHNGVTKKFKYRRNASCQSCDGEGGTNKTTCPKCGGSGYQVFQQKTPMGVMRQMVDCDRCESTGKIYQNNCTSCNSSGIKNIEETVEVNIPKGIRDNEALTFIGMGHSVKGGNPGRLIVKVMTTKHDQFVRNGDDLRYDLKLTYPQMVLGDKVEIPVISGGKIRVTIPPHSSVGDNLRIVNKGLNSSNGSVGDMIITLNIKIPEKLTNEQKDLIEKLKLIDESVAELKNS
jgi:molecular chaperone DnaJ